MNTTNNEEELKKIIARREGKMYGYYKATFDDDFTGGYPVEYDKELIDFCSSVRTETVEACKQLIKNQMVYHVNDDVELPYISKTKLLTNLDTISHE